MCIRQDWRQLLYRCYMEGVGLLRQCSEGEVCWTCFVFCSSSVTSGRINNDTNHKLKKLRRFHIMQQFCTRGVCLPASINKYLLFPQPNYDFDASNGKINTCTWQTKGKLVLVRNLCVDSRVCGLLIVRAGCRPRMRVFQIFRSGHRWVEIPVIWVYNTQTFPWKRAKPAGHYSRVWTELQ